MPVLPPSIWNWTLTVFEETLVETLIVPETVAPEAGEVMEIVGGVGGATLLTLMETAALVVVCAAALLATAVSEWLPLESEIVFSE